MSWDFVPLGHTSALVKGSGSGAWIITTVHGEEPAGFCAVMQSAALFSELDLPLVVIACANPSGLATGKRFGLEYPVAGVREDIAFRRGLIDLARFVRPWVVLDLHEDDKMPEEPGAYLYHHGKEHRLPQLILAALRANEVRIQEDWSTRFSEKMTEPGLIRGGRDHSIDDFLNTRLGAEVIVFETPTSWSLRARIDAHLIVLSLLKNLMVVGMRQNG